MDRSPRPLSPEFALLAACTLLDDARLAEVAAPLAQRPGFDWDRFVALGVFHGVEQVARLQLEHTLPGAMPAARKAELQRDFVHSAALYAAHTRMALTAVTALERARIPVLVLKGAALAGQLYTPTPEVRASSDVDILVPPEQLEAADAALRQAGLHRSWPEANPPEAARAMFLRFANVFDYQGPISGETVELHCRATLNPHAMPVSFAELDAASVEVETGYGTVRTFGGPLQMHYLCHHMLSQLPHRLKWFGDIARAMRLSGQRDVPAYVASNSGALPMESARLTGELLRSFELAIGEAASGKREQTRPSRDFERIVRAMERGRQVSVKRTWSRVPLELRQLLFVMRLVPGWRGKANEVLLTIGDPRDAVSLRLSPRFAVVYALAGPMLALGRFLKRVKTGAAPSS